MTLFDLSPDPLVVTDPAGIIARANRAAALLLAHPGPALVGRPLPAFIAKLDRRCFLARLARLRFGEAPRDEEWPLRLQASAGRSVPAAVAVASMPGAGSDGVALRLWRLRDLRGRRGPERGLRPGEMPQPSLPRQMPPHPDPARA